MKKIVEFNDPIEFDSINLKAETKLDNLKKVPFKKKDGDDFPELSPGEFCQSPDGKQIYALEYKAIIRIPGIRSIDFKINGRWIDK